MSPHSRSLLGCQWYSRFTYFPNIMKHLFIGGSADGQRIQTEGAHHYVVAISPDPATLHAACATQPSVEDIAYRRQYYHAHRFMDGMIVYAPDDWSSNKVLEAIIRRYPVAL